MRTKNTTSSGFTIVELLIVIIIIGILAAITIVAYNGLTTKAKIATLQSDLNNNAEILGVYKAQNGTYPSSQSSAGLQSSAGNNLIYTYASANDSYCLTATNSSLNYYVTSDNNTPSTGACPSNSTTETATVISGGSTSFSGYSGTEPATCPSVGGSWIKVPGNSLYGLPNGFCVQQYPASNVSSVATSQPNGPRWTGAGVNQPFAATQAAAVTSGSHLLTENEWMTIATNAAAQPSNWSGGSVGSGTLPVGSATAAYGGINFTLSNGQKIYFDTGNTAYYATMEWTCFTGTNANNCGLAQQYLPLPANAYYTDQLNLITNWGSLPTASGYYYGDPRYGNSALAPFVTSARNNGLGYMYTSGNTSSTTVYTFARGFWNGNAYDGLFTLYMNTNQTYAHAQYGFRAAYTP